MSKSFPYLLRDHVRNITLCRSLSITFILLAGVLMELYNIYWGERKTGSIVMCDRAKVYVIKRW